MQASIGTVDLYRVLNCVIGKKCFKTYFCLREDKITG
jgi:hypothetical protein